MPSRLDSVYSIESLAALQNDPRAADYEWRALHRDPAYYTFFQQALTSSFQRALDLGCGAGRLTLFLAPRVRTIVGLDLSPTLLMLARDRQRAQPQGHVEWVLGNMHDLPFPESSFDLILSCNALRLTDLPFVLPQVQTLLAPGGRLVIRDIVKSSVIPNAKLAPHFYATLKNLPSIAQTYGLKTAWAIFRNRLSDDGRDVMANERDLTHDQVQAIYTRTFPGCQIGTGPHQLRVLWDKPSRNQQ